MTISTEMLRVDLDLIDANPWQPRIGEDAEHVRKIADSIAASGLLQVPSARICNGRYQLAFGHSRLAAFKFLRDATDRGAEFATMPLNIVVMDDRQMADAAAAENVTRKDLSAIEMARGIKRYIDDFNVTQIEAGKVFGYSSQSAVSNLLRLLQLPDPVQQQVNAGKLPERYARELITLSRAESKAAVEVATQYIEAASEKDTDENAAANMFARALRANYARKGVALRDATWDLSWPGKPITIERPGVNQPSEVPACKGCPFFVNDANTWNQYCLKPACFNLKIGLWLQHALETASKKHAIPLLGKGEEATAVYGGQRDMFLPGVVRQAIKDKHPSLRIAQFVLKKGEYYYHAREREDLIGFSVIVLVTTDAAALKRKYAGENKKEKEPETSWQRENRLRNEREKRNVRIVELAAPHMAQAISVPSALLPALHEQTGYMPDEAKRKWRERTDADRKTDIMQKLLEKLTDIHAYNNAPTEDKVIQQIHDLAGAMNIRLPQGWHHEAIAVPVNGKAKTTKSKGGK